MVEILGNNLENFFLNHNSMEVAYRSYKGEQYEVWSVSDEEFKQMCDMTEEEFEYICEKAGYVDEFGFLTAWWRSSEGSNLRNHSVRRFSVNGHWMIGYDEVYPCSSKKFDDLSDYLCRKIGCSLPKNVCAVAMDLAKLNDMTMGQLFEKYEG